VPQQALLSTKNDVFFRPFSLKVPSAYTLAKILVDAVPPGSRVVAPPAVSPWIVTFRQHPYPMVVRRQYLKRYLGTIETQRRLRMTQFVNGGKVKAWQVKSFLQDIDRTGTVGVCFRRRLSHVGWVQKGLKDKGFRRIYQSRTTEIWTYREPLTKKPQGVGHNVRRNRLP
jgi:hypothetical protein